MKGICTACGAEQEVAAYSRINVAEHPELKERVMDGSLFVWECSRCGTVNLARYPVLYHDPGEKLMIWLLPEDALPADRMEAVEKALETGLAGYVLRRVPDAGTLMEKVHIFDCGLDDRVIEMVKYVTRMEVSGAETAPFKFYRMEGPDSELILSFPQQGQMQMVRVGFHVYEDCRGILQRSAEVRTPPGFARIDAAWLGRYFR